MPSAPARAPRLACRALPPETLFLPSVHLLDPGAELDTVADLLVAKGRIADIGTSVKVPAGAEVLEELRGCWVFPGFVDMHAHLRTPGQEYKEDVESAARAAAAGGFVTVVGMANTRPVVDVGPLASWVLGEAAARADVYVGQVGAVSKGLAGETLAELRELADAGVVAFSDDGRPLNNANLLLFALRYLRGTGRPLLLHLEDAALGAGGSMHEGKWSARLGLHGVPSSSESGPLARDLEVILYAAAEAAAVAGVAAGAAAAGASHPAPATSSVPLVHFQHLSAAESARLVRSAKAEGLPVTAEVTPHHLLLTDEAVRSFDPSLKINPPLRSATDREALVAALAEGTIDCIATDHAPHAPHEKEVPFEEAPSGTVGLETAFAAVYGGLVVTGAVPLARVVDALSAAPSRVLGLQPPRLAVGEPARFCAVDVEERWRVRTEDLRGKCRNSAFLGTEVQGRVRLTVVDGARSTTVLGVPAVYRGDRGCVVLENGRVFTGFGFGAEGAVFGEIVFNTGMTGYQEIVTDPSYHGQMVTFTYPMLGNYGVSEHNLESGQVRSRAVVVREVKNTNYNLTCPGAWVDWWRRRSSGCGRGGYPRAHPGHPPARCHDRLRGGRERREREPAAGGDEGFPGTVRSGPGAARHLQRAVPGMGRRAHHGRGPECPRAGGLCRCRSVRWCWGAALPGGGVRFRSQALHPAPSDRGGLCGPGGARHLHARRGGGLSA